ncbi:hypothetical protein ACHAXS_002725 [Conticribra weissflogii]
MINYVKSHQNGSITPKNQTDKLQHSLQPSESKTTCSITNKRKNLTSKIIYLLIQIDIFTHFSILH